MNNKEKLRNEYRNRVGSTYNMTWEWYAEWLEKELIEARVKLVNKNDHIQVVTDAVCEHKSQTEIRAIICDDCNEIIEY